MSFYKYEVGKPYHPSVHRWPEGSEYNFAAGEHVLLLRLNRPSAEEIHAVRKARAEFGLLVEPPVIALCYRFLPGLPWSDAPYSWHLLKAKRPEMAVLPIGWEEGSPHTRAILHVILIDAATGIIRAMRALTFSPEFTRVLHQAIWEQAHAAFDEAAYHAAIAALYRRYPSSDALAAACTVRCEGGA